MFKKSFEFFTSSSRDVCVLKWNDENDQRRLLQLIYGDKNRYLLLKNSCEEASVFSSEHLFT